MPKRSITRRGLLKGAAGAASLFTIVPRHVLGGVGYKTPGETLTHGTIGTGNMGMHHVAANGPGRPPVQLAVCDVDKTRLANGLKKAGPPCKAYSDWREVIDRKDIDILHVVTPPHWHALIDLAAVQAGKDAYVEKPFTRTIAEGQTLVAAVERYGRIMWINTHGRTAHYGRMLRRTVVEGCLGRPLTIRMPGVPRLYGKTDLAPQGVPEVLDYDMWLGPAPHKPYNAAHVHYNFRNYWDYDGGGMTDWGQHYFDPVQYALGKDEELPVEVEAAGPPQHPFAVGHWYWAAVRYADGTTLLFPNDEQGGPKPPVDLDPAVTVQGPKGKIYGRWQRSDPPELMERLKAVPDEPLTGFDAAVRTRYRGSGNKPNAAAAHHSCTVVNLVNIAIRLGRKLRFDPAAQRFIGDEGANALVDQPMRAPWHM